MILENKRVVSAYILCEFHLPIKIEFEGKKYQAASLFRLRFRPTEN